MHVQNTIGNSGQLMTFDLNFVCGVSDNGHSQMNF